VLAYYLPFHFYRDRWGIYIRDMGILELASHIVSNDWLSDDEEWLIGFAAKCLFLHEFFHHSTEVACSRLEYPLPAARLGNDHYTPYFKDNVASYIEEAVANAYVARNIDKYYQNPPPGRRMYTRVKSGLLGVMSRQPKPYSEFREFVGNGRFARARDLLIDGMYHPWLSNRPSMLLGAGIYFADITPVATYCPLYLVVDSPDRLIRIGKPFPKAMGLQVFVRSPDHPPPHIHVRNLDNGEETRYPWPSLKPYEGDIRFSTRLEKNLRAYTKEHRAEITKRISSVLAAAQ
jgi:hypothetical protein